MDRLNFFIIPSFRNFGWKGELIIGKKLDFNKKLPNLENQLYSIKNVQYAKQIELVDYQIQEYGKIIIAYKAENLYKVPVGIAALAVRVASLIYAQRSRAGSFGKSSYTQ